MEKLDRSALKNKFKKGRLPAEQDFANLIDSMVNILEEGFDRSANDGLRMSQTGNGRLLSFYRNIAVDSPQWFLELGSSDNKLHLGTPASPRVLSLHASDGDSGARIAVGINQEDPQATLDVGGTLASNGRRGQFGELPVAADGQWHDITSALTGCEAFEIVAGVGGADADGKYALLHAFALNTFNGKNSITPHEAWFGNKCNRIDLRWQSVPELGQFHFKLQMRVQCPYGKDIWVKYHLTRLWFDPLMLDSNQPPL
ncbi:type 2 periplasmic-binding domain-containing protein [Cellvibrio japonicus]|uniref:Uncharacterized protein n=1 Tax=Cellvibrio japonicus (strain Ueda107) TaxID=498211 RepID=B3PHT7_CELJU|nr:hypothetical protein [Cellvibrio japonicus]ACE85188.1 hypothetical protein CJA_3679 [Cellvibrio japonicus Ueda107]QEI13879.1 hypothetical protein FY117_17755 [Cellvibrio japonicus]QEI17453.1 hypothetical protein FY116_17760 [Cellvibrio japonicus]QEI21029.1 hypothetical protein FY115_17755 [Cellvibrio japonicus]